MIDLHDFLRSRLLSRVDGSYNPEKVQIAEDRVSLLFGDQFDFMVNEAKQRIRMGTFRYEQPDKPWNILARLGIVPSYLTKLREKLKLYEETKNKEMLVDALNYILLEFNEPCEEGTYYESTERNDNG